MTLLIVGAIVGLLGAGVAWLLYRIAWEISRFDDWDSPPIKGKREHWR